MSDPGLVSTEAGIFEYLSENAALENYVKDRIFAGPLPEGEDLPAITFILINGDYWVSQSGSSGIKEGHYQIDVWVKDTDHALMVEIAGIITTAFNGKRGGMGSRNIQAAKIVRELTLPEPNVNRLHRVIDVKITDSN